MKKTKKTRGVIRFWYVRWSLKSLLLRAEELLCAKRALSLRAKGIIPVKKMSKMRANAEHLEQSEQLRALRAKGHVRLFLIVPFPRRGDHHGECGEITII